MPLEEAMRWLHQQATFHVTAPHGAAASVAILAEIARLKGVEQRARDAGLAFALDSFTCPTCHTEFVAIERRPEGNRTCKNGHVWRIVAGIFTNVRRG